VENKKIQKRQVVVTEFENHSYGFDSGAWKINVKENEAESFFYAWKNGLLNENVFFNNKKPKILINQNDNI